MLAERAERKTQDDVIVMAGDDVVVTKAGKQTHGLGRFFSSLYGKKVPGPTLSRLVAHFLA